MTLPSGGSRPGGRLDYLNPYRIGARLILDRLRWDVSPTSWKHRRKLTALRDKHRDEKAIILCNGPSLSDIDLPALDGIFTFGLNKINLLFEQTDFRPSAIVAVNPFIIEQNSDYFSASEIPLFLDWVAVGNGVKARDNIYFLHSSDFPYFSRDCSISVFQGYTVTYVALQLAYHMGFTKVALVGCDHDYHMDGEPNSISYNSKKDPAHFCDDYFSPTQPWQFPDLKNSELYYDLARRCYEENDRMIVNASVRTKLDVFPRMQLDDFINKS
jgi:hypothetical protein